MFMLLCHVHHAGAKASKGHVHIGASGDNPVYLIGNAISAMPRGNLSTGGHPTVPVSVLHDKARPSHFHTEAKTELYIQDIGVGTMGAPGAGAPLYFLTVTLC